jgi:hypothetical protein
VATHLHGHSTHTHKQYNEQFMERSSSPAPLPRPALPAAAEDKEERERGYVNPAKVEQGKRPRAPSPEAGLSLAERAGLPPEPVMGNSRLRLTHFQMHLINWPHADCAREEEEGDAREQQAGLVSMEA